MIHTSHANFLENLFATGINHKNADIKIRTDFHLADEQKESFLRVCGENNFTDVILMATCNRTEIYGVGNIFAAQDILCEITETDRKIFFQSKFEKKDHEALRHIFSVSSGLESQILGDYEISGQFNNACKTSKKINLLGSFLERLANTALEASKKIKTQTELSSGTVSFSYAAIEILRERFGNEAINILLVGTGKFGTIVAKNLKSYLPKANISVSNRTDEKAKRLADENGFTHVPFEEVRRVARNYEVILACAAVKEYIIQPYFFKNHKTKLILDLSLPMAVNPSVSSDSNIALLGIDDVSKILNNTLEKRKTYLSEAHKIIDAYIGEFLEWNKVFQHRDKIRHVKEALVKLSSRCPHLQNLSEHESKRRMNKAMSQFISELKNKPIQEIHLNDTIEYFMKLAHQSISRESVNTLVRRTITSKEKFPKICPLKIF